MEIDNINLILPFLNFESEDDFYYLQIIQRKKENPQLGSNSRVIKNYYIKSSDYLLNKYDEIKKLCDLFNARAMIRLNKGSFEKVGMKTMINIVNTITNKDYKYLKNSYDRACGQHHNDSQKKWILDIDNIKKVSPLMLAYIDHKCKPLGSKILSEIPSKTGFHLITKPFDCEEFKVLYPEVDIHKDNPTNLYIS